jgi:hypothetical protein
MFLFWVEIVCLLYCCCVFVICVPFAFMCDEHFFSNRKITSRCPHRVGWQVLCFSIRVECSSTLVCHITKPRPAREAIYLCIEDHTNSCVLRNCNGEPHSPLLCKLCFPELNVNCTQLFLARALCSRQCCFLVFSYICQLWYKVFKLDAVKTKD